MPDPIAAHPVASGALVRGSETAQPPGHPRPRSRGPRPHSPPRFAGAGTLAALLAIGSPLLAQATSAGPTSVNPAALDWRSVGTLEVAATETTIGQFRRWVQATSTVTAAERAGGGQLYEGGWVQRRGWTWARPFGSGHTPQDDEPAVHVTFDEARAFCAWAGGRLPREAEWRRAAYTEQRAQPPAPFQTGRAYPYPTGDRPDGAQCLDDCGPQAAARAVKHGVSLSRGLGPARAGATPPGVNGLHDLGANVWEWVDDPPGDGERLTLGGSWWYGAGPMHADHRASKPRQTAVVYIGFRCVRDAKR